MRGLNDRLQRKMATYLDLSYSRSFSTRWQLKLNMQAQERQRAMEVTGPTRGLKSDKGWSGTAGEAFDGELDLSKPPPSMNLADEWTPTPDNEAAKDNKY